MAALGEVVLERQLDIQCRFLGFKEQGLVLCQVVDAGAAEHRGHLGGWRTPGNPGR